MEQERPKVGVGIIIIRNGKVLIGERLAGHGASTFMLPGGHVEHGETFEETARREVEEETGLKDITILKLVSLSNKLVYEKHYVTIGMLAESLSGEPINTEPNISKNWKWYDIKNLPENMFLPSKKMLENWLAGTVYSDA